MASLSALRLTCRSLGAPLLAAGALTLTGCAQPEVQALGRGQSAHDALEYAIEIDVDPAEPHLEGTVTYRFRADQALDRVVLDAVRSEEWKVEFFRADDTPIVAAWNEDQVELPLGRIVPAGAEFGFRARISGKPADGFYFGTSRYGDALAFTDHYSIRARGWLPCEDHPGDRSAFRVMIQYPEGLRAVASGARVTGGPAYDPKPGRTILHHATQSDIPPYMFAIGIGPYAVLEEGGDARLQPHLVYRQDVGRAEQALRHHATWMRAMEERIGPFPYGKYMVFQCPTRWGGFEAPGNVQISEGLFDSPRGVGVLAHELAHMWFGDGVGYAEWREVWLSEGFASYFGPWLWAQTGGPSFRDSLDQMRERWLGSADGRTKPIRWDGFPHPDVALNTNTYQKGAWVLHMLRGELGDESFFGALRSYFAEFAGTSIRTEDFVASIEASSGRDLGWFFDQWLDRVGCPRLRVAMAGGKITVEQVQEGDPYRLRVPLQWRDPAGKTVKRIVEMHERQVELAVEGAAPGSLVVDPDVELLFRPAK